MAGLTLEVQAHVLVLGVDEPGVGRLAAVRRVEVRAGHAVHVQTVHDHLGRGGVHDALHQPAVGEPRHRRLGPTCRIKDT